MNRVSGIIILVVGIVLLVYGLNAADSLSSGFSKVFEGTPSTKSMILLIGGAILTIMGAGSLFRK